VIVALGETHGTHELLRLRNRLFQYLVEELDFTAIAVETGVTESMLAEDFVMGSAVDKKSAARSVFSNNRTISYVENFELIDWMRRHNASVTNARKIHFFGLDMSGQINGDFVQSRIALDAALSYLRRVDSDLAAQFQKRLEPFLPKFFETFGEPLQALSLQWRQQRPARWRKVLIDGVQHETYSEVLSHNRHELDRMLTPEMVHHFLPKFTADSVFAKQRAPETDQCCVFVG
jgi:Erythromycin esterase